LTSTLILDRFVRTPASGPHSRVSRMAPFLRAQGATLAASFRAARAYEQAESVDARREVLDRFFRYIRV
jgi:hypothetical protein